MKTNYKKITVAYGEPTVTKLQLPDEPWAKQLYAPEVCVLSDGACKTCSTTFGCLEGRIYLKGSDTVVGLPCQSVLGESWKAKRHTLCQLTVDQLQELAKTSNGFVLKLKADDMVLIPSGFIITNAADEATQYVRWPISSDTQDNYRVMHTLSTLLHEFSEVRNERTGYPQFLQFLQE